LRKLALALLLLTAALYGTFQLSRARTFQLFGTIVPRVETERKVVALTFDDGPRGDRIDEVLAPLAKHGVKATFFVCGAEIEKNPEATAKLVRAGHELGNHSYSHVRMVFKSPRFIRDEFERTDALIRAAGHRGPIHVRAPYCKKLVALPWYFRQHGRIHVTFDVEPETDPKIDGDPGLIIAHVLERTEPGSIVLLHPWYGGREASRASIDAIVMGLKNKGFTFVTVNELLNMRRA
jgi:peptidoglycan/xylan/chitin deacetylase (PgdA/CDA1 family)